MTVNQLAKKAHNISLPIETIEEILLRLPVKSILRFRSVSKPWLSRISDPSFTKLHFTRATADHRTALFISIYNNSTRQRYFLSAANNGGPATHLMTLDHASHYDVTAAQHLNGLVFFTCMKWNTFNYHFVINPSTHKIYQIPEPTSLISCSSGDHDHMCICYLFGFDESRNEHKIVYLLERTFEVLKQTTIEVMVFSMSSYSWRKIDVEPPVGFSTWDRLHYDTKGSVCVNSVVHLLLRGSFDILAFDLRTEKFSIIKTPQSVKPRAPTTVHIRNGEPFVKRNKPRFIKINGSIGVVCHDQVVESNEMHVWILQDYEKRVWVRESILFPKPWVELDGPVPLDVLNMNEILFSSSKMTGAVIRLPIYNMKSGRYKSFCFTLDQQFMCPETVEFNQIKGYVESLVPP